MCLIMYVCMGGGVVKGKGVGGTVGQFDGVPPTQRPKTTYFICSPEFLVLMRFHFGDILVLVKIQFW